MGRTIQPCQFAYSLASLARQCGVSVQQARAAVGNMQKARAATIETTHHYSLITLINAQGCGVSLPVRQHSEEQSAQHELQQANNTRGNNNKKNKERRIERRNDIPENYRLGRSQEIIEYWMYTLLESNKLRHSTNSPKEKQSN